MEAIGLDYQHALSHYLLRIALLRQGMQREALLSFGTCTRLAPDWNKPHLWLLRAKRRMNVAEQDLEPHKKVIRRRRDAGKRLEDVRTAAIERQRQRAVEREKKREQAVADLLNVDASWDDTPMVSMNLTLVTGLPRAGGTAMMRMLKAGGVDVLSDAEEEFGWSPGQDLPGNPNALDPARGRVIYLPSALLSFLPRIHHYRVVFMARPIGELVISQQRNANDSRPAGDELPVYEQARLLLKHRNGVLSALRTAPNVDLLQIDYPRLVETPEGEVDRVRDFLGEDLLHDRAAMIRSLDPALHGVKLTDSIVPRSLKTGLFGEAPVRFAG